MKNFDVAHSRWLDPPEPNFRGPCDGCGWVGEWSDMHAVRDDYWLCDECYAEWLEEIKIHPEAENE